MGQLVLPLLLLHGARRSPVSHSRHSSIAWAAVSLRLLLQVQLCVLPVLCSGVFMPTTIIACMLHLLVLLVAHVERHTVLWQAPAATAGWG